MLERATNLTQVHHNTLVDLLPQVSTEYLDEGDLQCGNLAVHEDSRQVKLHLKTHVHLTKGKKPALNNENQQCLFFNTNDYNLSVYRFLTKKGAY